MRRTPSKSAGRRGGFTLVELLVAAALTVLVMAILATAFQTGMQTLSQLKSVVGLSEHLRSVETVVLRDLKATHLEDEQGVAVRVSSAQQQAANGGRGYFLVTHGSAATLTTTDPFYREADETEDGVPSYRAADHSLTFTVKRAAASVDDVFLANARLIPSPSTTNVLENLLSQSRTDFAADPTCAGEWAEVAYFLEPSAISTTGDGGTQLTLYTLRRRQRVVAPSSAIEPLNSGESLVSKALEYPEVSFNQMSPASQAVFNTPLTVAARANRMAISTIPLAFPSSAPNFANQGHPNAGSDILLTNVVSMQVRVLTNQSGTVYLDVIPGNGSYPHRIDTADGPADPNYTAPTAKPVLRAVQIKLRVYDTKNRITRQVTLTQDL